MLSREWNLSVSDLSKLHQLSKDLLDALDEHLPDRVGGSNGWNFEKAQSIWHKVREIIMGVGLRTLLVRALSMIISI